jgi:hypothetical protein
MIMNIDTHNGGIGYQCMNSISDNKQRGTKPILDYFNLRERILHFIGDPVEIIKSFIGTNPKIPDIIADDFTNVVHIERIIWVEGRKIVQKTFTIEAIKTIACRNPDITKHVLHHGRNRRLAQSIFNRIDGKLLLGFLAP